MMINILLITSYGLLFIATLGMAIFPIVNAFKKSNPWKATARRMSLLLGLFCMALLVSHHNLAGYVKYGVNASIEQWIDAALLLLYTVGLITIAVIIFTEFRKMFLTRETC